LAIGIAISGVVAAFRYRHLVPLHAVSPPGSGFTRRFRQAAFTRSRKVLLAVVYFLASAVIFIVPIVVAVSYFERTIDYDLRPGVENLRAPFHSFCRLRGARQVSLFRGSASIKSLHPTRADSIPGSLLLRSFQDDLTPLERRPDVRNWRFGSTADLPLTLEEALEHVLWAYGPVIAIGRHGIATSRRRSRYVSTMTGGPVTELWPSPSAWS
jgi:hypothetical protein